MTTIEQLAGVPSAAELTALANEWFPDLAGSISGVPGSDVASSSAAGMYPAAGAVHAAVPEVNTSEAARQPSSIPVYGDFDWEHPFGSSPEGYGTETSAISRSEGYGSRIPAGGNPESYGSLFQTVNSLGGYGSLPQAFNSPESYGSLPQTVNSPDGYSREHPAGRDPKGYAPVVMSQTQAAESERSIDAPTSLGGDRVEKRENEEKSYASGDESIYIGGTTLARIRSDFPILSEKINGNPLVWLDNGATTQRPRVVIDRLTQYYEHENSNVHRGAHALAARSTDAYEGARDIVRDFIGAPSSEEIIFVRGTTEGINLVANAYVKPLLEPGDEIIVSVLEHHANIVPWQLVAQETGAVIKVIPCDESGQLLLHEYEKLFTKRTKFVSVAHVSNVLGTVTPVEELIATAHRHGVRILIDGAQSVAHIPVNVSALDADFFVFSGHKIYAPTGIGVVYGKKELLDSARPYHGGGNMIADVTFERTIYNPAPNKFEAGTGSIADAVGLGAALTYLSGIGMPCVFRWEHELVQYAMRELASVNGLHLIGTAPGKASALAFKLDGHPDEEVGKRLDEYGIAVRTGHHCAQPVLRRFGYESCVRPTIALYNSPGDIDAMVRVLKAFA